MGGGLRRPGGPFQWYCVLVAAVLAVAFSISPLRAQQGQQQQGRFLEGVDLGISRSTLVDTFRRGNEIGGIDDKVGSIAKLLDEELHLVVRANSAIGSIEQRAGRKLNFSDIGSGTQSSTGGIFSPVSGRSIRMATGSWRIGRYGRAEGRDHECSDPR